MKPFFVDDEPDSEPYSENLEFFISLIKTYKVQNLDFLAPDTLNYPNWINYYDILTKETDVTIGASNNSENVNTEDGLLLTTEENENLEAIHENLEITSSNTDIESVYFKDNIQYYNYW